jgi:putative heme-binding domain-containing protein
MNDRLIRRFSLPLVTLFICWATTAFAQENASDEIDFTVPEGFSVEKVYQPDTTGSVIAITFDAEGQLVYSREGGPVVTLLPDDDSYEERVFTDEVTNAQGLFFDGNDLLVVGERSDTTGLYRVRDTNGDGTGDSIETITLTSGPIAEHGPHDVMFGPDGYLYWVQGNHTAIVPTPAHLSPHRDYDEGVLLPSYTDPRGHADTIRAPGGTILRNDLSADDSDWEMVAGGFRNQYDAGFNLTGELFTFDSDMEWDIDLPWFRPVRTVHIVPGGEYGWRTGSRKWPAYFPESLPALTDIGRGSPTGVTFYQHSVYPDKYHDAAIYADWSRGRILAGFQEKSGATYSEETVEFVEGTPLNVTDVSIGPDGYMYFSMGGRDTKGGLYRVVYDDSSDTRDNSQPPIQQALAQEQPRSAWGRAEVEALRTDMGSDAWEKGLKEVVRDTRAPSPQRMRALELLHVHGPGASIDFLASLREDPAWQVRAASTYYLGLHGTESTRRELIDRLDDADAMVRRRACEALVRTGIHPGMPVPEELIKNTLTLLSDNDRFVRYAARELLERTNRNAWREKVLALEKYPAAVDGLMALVQTAEGTQDVPVLLEREIELLEDDPPAEHLTGLLRIIQRTMMHDKGIWYSYLYDDIGELLLERFPSENADLNAELARTLGYVKPDGTIETLRLELEHSTNSRQQQIFYAYVLRTLTEGWTTEQKDTMVEWFQKVQDEGWSGGASYRGYIQNMWTDFLEILPEDGRQLAMEQVPTFSPGYESELAADSTAFRGEDYNELLSQQELKEYLVWDPMSHKGDPARGVEAYEKAFCGSCHRFGEFGQGGFGPDLTTVRQRFSREDLVDAIVYPSKSMSDFWAAIEVTTNDGQSYIGTVTDEGANSMTLTTRTQQQITIDKSNIASRERAQTSPMPDYLLHNLSRQEMIDLILFLEAGPEAAQEPTPADDAEAGE